MLVGDVRMGGLRVRGDPRRIGAVGGRTRRYMRRAGSRCVGGWVMRSVPSLIVR